MLAVNFTPFTSPTRKRDVDSILGEQQPSEELGPVPMVLKRRRRLMDEGPSSPSIRNRMLHLQYDNELQELRLQLEKKDRDLVERDQRIQYLENQLSSFHSKVQQFDTLAKIFMDQNAKLKQKEEEVSNMSTVVQKLVMENKTLKNQLILMDREQMVTMFGN